MAGLILFLFLTEEYNWRENCPYASLINLILCSAVRSLVARQNSVDEVQVYINGKAVGQNVSSMMISDRQYFNVCLNYSKEIFSNLSELLENEKTYFDIF